jgi:hypothetical protein
LDPDVRKYRPPFLTRMDVRVRRLLVDDSSAADKNTVNARVAGTVPALLQRILETHPNLLKASESQKSAVSVYLEPEQWVGHGREREIDRREPPDEDEEVKPKPERTMKIPIDPPNVPPPVHPKAPAPVFDAGPLDHRFGQAQRYETDTA